MNEISIKRAENGWTVSYMEDECLRTVLFEIKESYTVVDEELAEARAFKALLNFLAVHYDVGQDGFSQSTLHVEIKPGDEVENL